MDRFFLAALVRELRPDVQGRRARGAGSWGQAGFAITLSGRPKSSIVVSLAPEAPGFFLGTPLSGFTAMRLPLRLGKLIVGSELVNVRAAQLDRVVTFEWKRSRASGAQQRLELVVEWVGNRSAIFLIERETKQILDVFSPALPRKNVGEVYEPLPSPPGTTHPAESIPSFRERWTEARREGLGERQAIGLASGFSPDLAHDVWRLHTQEHVTLDEAFETVRQKLENDPRPVVIVPEGSFQERQTRYRTSPLSLSYRSKHERHFETFNDAARAYVKEASRFAESKRRYQTLGAQLRKRLKKHRLLLEKIERDRASIEDPTLLRRRGELLLAGLSHAKRINGEVVVPDPYDPEGSPVRVPVDPRRDLVQNANRYFERSRRMERSIEKLEARIAHLTDELQHLETSEVALENAVDLADLVALSEEMQEEGIVRRAETGDKESSGPVGPRRIAGSDGCEILVGRSARSNDKVTFEMARAEDLWLHAAGIAGAHVVLRLPPGQDANDEQIREAAAAAAYYSKARSSTSVEVMYTLRKNVRKIRKAPSGTVRVSQYSSVRVRPALPPEPENDESVNQDKRTSRE